MHIDLVRFHFKYLCCSIVELFLVMLLYIKSVTPLKKLTNWKRVLKWFFCANIYDMRLNIVQHLKWFALIRVSARNVSF